MESKEFLSDLGLMYDVLEEIAHLSLKLQQQGLTLLKADKLMRRSIRQLSSMKEHSGDRLAETQRAVNASMFKGITLVSNSRLSQINPNQFLVSLVANLEQRLFTTCSSRNASDSDRYTQSYATLLSHLEVLDPVNWPDGVTLNNYCESEVKSLCDKFNLESLAILDGYRDYKENPNKFQRNSFL